MVTSLKTLDHGLTKQNELIKVKNRLIFFIKIDQILIITFLRCPKAIKEQNMRQFYPIILLIISNVFMTFAWYGHLNFKSAPLWLVVLASWGIAFFEYCFQVPANRIGHDYFTAPELKVMQEAITIIVFCIFSVLYLKEELRWNYIVGFALILLAVFFVFKKWD